MKIHDISLTISNDIVTWPGDPKVDIQLPIQIQKGDPCNVSRWQIGAHTGTHTDAPFHFLDDGIGIDEVPLDRYIGPCLVVEVNPKINIEREDLVKVSFKGHTRILFKTRNSNHWKNGNMEFDKDFVAVGITGADYLVEKKIKFVGVDYLSVESFHAEFDHPVHKKLLGAGIVVVEGMNLSAIKPGEYELVCMPLKIKHGDGTPVRAALRELPKSSKAKKSAGSKRKSEKKKQVRKKSKSKSKRR